MGGEGGGGEGERVRGGRRRMKPKSVKLNCLAGKNPIC